MLQPKRQKYRKQMRGRMKGKAGNGASVSFGEFGLKSMGVGWVTAAQLEASRRAIAHETRRGGKIWIRVFPDKPVTGKSAGVRMGGGKGDIARYVAVVRPGNVLFEIAGVPELVAKKALKLAAAKLPVLTKIVARV